MCGRYTLTISAEELKKAFPDVKFYFDHTPRFNIAPMQMIPVIRKETNVSFRADLFKWGVNSFMVKRRNDWVPINKCQGRDFG